MTELKQRALAVALREHQEEQPQETCKNCGKPLERFPNMLRCLEWRHSDGYYNCGGRPGHAETYAEPVQSAKKDRKDAGDERLLCAVLFEEGEPN